MTLYINTEAMAEKTSPQSLLEQARAQAKDPIAKTVRALWGVLGVSVESVPDQTIQSIDSGAPVLPPNTDTVSVKSSKSGTARRGSMTRTSVELDEERGRRGGGRPQPSRQSRRDDIEELHTRSDTADHEDSVISGAGSVAIPQSKEVRVPSALEQALRESGVVSQVAVAEPEGAIEEVVSLTPTVGSEDTAGVDAAVVTPAVSGALLSLRRRKSQKNQKKDGPPPTPENTPLVPELSMNAYLPSVVAPGDNQDWLAETQVVVARASGAESNTSPPPESVTHPDQDASLATPQPPQFLASDPMPSFDTIPTATPQESSNDRYTHGDVFTEQILAAQDEAMEKKGETSFAPQAITSHSTDVYSTPPAGVVESVSFQDIPVPVTGTIEVRPKIMASQVALDEILQKNVSVTQQPEGDDAEESAKKINSDDVEMAPVGSFAEAAVFATYGLDENGKLKQQETRELTLKQKLAAETAQTAEEYVRAAEKKRTFGNRMRDILGLKNTALPNEDEQIALRAYQAAFRAETANDIAEMKQAYQEQIDGKEAINMQDVEFAKLSLQKNIADIVGSAHMQANINLYNARMAMEFEKKPGIMAKIKKFGEAYNKLKLWKKVLIGASVAGLTVASGAGLLGAAGASMAFGAVAARRGLGALGSFVAFDASLEALSRKMAKKAAEAEAEMYVHQEQMRSGIYNADTEERMKQSEAGQSVLENGSGSAESLDDQLTRLAAHLDTEIIDKAGDSFEARVRGLDRRRLVAMAGGIGVAFGLPSALQYLSHTDVVQSAVSEATRGVGDTVQEKVTETAADGVSSAVGAVKEVAKEKASGAAAKLTALIENEALVPKGGSIWTMLKHGIVEKLDSQDFGDIKGLDLKNSAQMTYINDYLKDVELKARGGKSLLQIGEKFVSHITPEDIQKAAEGAAKLADVQQNDIAARLSDTLSPSAIDISSTFIDGQNSSIDDVTRDAALASVDQTILSGSSPEPLLTQAVLRFGGESLNATTYTTFLIEAGFASDFRMPENLMRMPCKDLVSQLISRNVRISGMTYEDTARLGKYLASLKDSNGDSLLAKAVSRDPKITLTGLLNMRNGITI